MTDTERILKQVDALSLPNQPSDGPESQADILKRYQGALTLVRAVYGSDSTQETTLTDAMKVALEKKTIIGHNLIFYVWPVVEGTLNAIKSDVEAGLAGDLRRRGAGEVLADMLTLAKDALAEGSEGAKNVAAVLTAASFEDTIRKMGAAFAGINDRPKLETVLGVLKTKDIISGAPFTTAQSYLKFRNDALHADWGKIDQPIVSSCVAFTEGQILKHFS